MENESRCGGLEPLAHKLAPKLAPKPAPNHTLLPLLGHAHSRPLEAMATNADATA